MILRALQTHPIPTAPTSEVIVVAVLYFVVVAAIAIWAARRTRTAEDFFVAGKGIGVWTMTLAAMAATLSGFIFIGGPGADVVWERRIGPRGHRLRRRLRRAA